MAPVVIYAEPGDWQKRPDDKGSTEKAESIRKIQNVVAGALCAFAPTVPTIVVTVITDLQSLAPVLGSEGAFDRQFALKPRCARLIAERWLERLPADRCCTTLRDNIEKLGALLKSSFDGSDSLKMASLQLSRLAHRKQRPIEFSDVLELAIRGPVERDPSLDDPVGEVMRRKTAFHEAGHAAAAILTSDGQNIPEYVSIVPSNAFAGVVFESLTYASAPGSETSYTEFKQKILILLAGRAAEEIAFGPQAVSGGATSDLERATRLALDAFGLWGFATSMDSPRESSSNLAVVIGRWTDQDYAAVYPLIRVFLSDAYQEALSLLASNRPLLEKIADRLLVDPFIDQRELQTLCDTLDQTLPESDEVPQ